MRILDFIYPKQCYGCKKTRTYFCLDCASKAKPHFPQVCPVCERPSPDGIRHKYCQKPFSPNGLHSIWAYEGIPRKLITKLKYKFIEDLAKDLSLRTTEGLQKYKPLTSQSPVAGDNKITLVPIPLHWKRQNWRGFNQSEELGRLIAQKMGWKVENLLERVKNTNQQVGLKGQDRKTNVDGVFSVLSNIPVIAPTRPTSNLVLFDDVWTTGSTLKEATKALKKSGVRNVWCLTLAR